MTKAPSKAPPPQTPPSKGSPSSPPSHARPSSKGSPTTRGTVLIVDDDPVVLQALAECLTTAGFEVVTRSQALGTSQWIAQHEVDLILLDLVMPAMSGVDLATFLKRRGLTQKLSVILHSGKKPSELGPLVRQTGALGAIAKTDDTLTFLTEFERLADRHFRQKESAETPKPESPKKMGRP